jgi:formylglycine-generating enzyme required for sulfatase activity
MTNEIGIEMVLIPSGTFSMGSSEEEANSYKDEYPQHLVSVPQFFMGKYTVTQSQWRVVAEIPKVDRELKADPSHFRGDSLPVDSVNWHDAIEFCKRLSKETGRKYRLPSEAEWEYACRAGTQTPFHFGDTLSAELANYGEYRGRTTNVGSFLPNAFGLHDMHGNVCEWCLDHWHENYQGAPTDGSAWVNDDGDGRRVIRGGEWYDLPWYCRSAFRSFSSPDFRYDGIGFRVVCSAPRTLQ